MPFVASPAQSQPRVTQWHQPAPCGMRHTVAGASALQQSDQLYWRIPRIQLIQLLQRIAGAEGHTLRPCGKQTHEHLIIMQ